VSCRSRTPGPVASHVRLQLDELSIDKVLRRVAVAAVTFPEERPMRALVRGAVGASAVLLAALLSGDVSAQARKSCHPDGKPVEPQVIFSSSGGTYGENLERIFFRRFREECGVQVTQVTD